MFHCYAWVPCFLRALLAVAVAAVTTLLSRFVFLSRSFRSYEGIEVDDISLINYIAVKPHEAVFVPHTAGRYQLKRFRKAQVGNMT